MLHTLYCQRFPTCFQDSEQYVEKLLYLFERFSKLVTEAFSEDPRFLTARDKAYKKVVNDIEVFKLELPSKTVSLAFGWWVILIQLFSQSRIFYVGTHECQLHILGTMVL